MNIRALCLYINSKYMLLKQSRRSLVTCRALPRLPGLGPHMAPAFGTSLYGSALSVIESIVFREMTGTELVAMNKYTAVSAPIQNLAGSVEPACISASRRGRSVDMFATVALGIGALATASVWIISRSMSLDEDVRIYFCLRMCSLPTFTLYNTCTALLKYERRLSDMLKVMVGAFCFYAGLLCLVTQCIGMDLVTLGVCQSVSELFYLGILLYASGIRPKLPDWPFVKEAVGGIALVASNNVSACAMSGLRATVARGLDTLDQAAHQLALTLASCMSMFGKSWTIMSQCILPTSLERSRDTVKIVVGIHASSVILFVGVWALCSHVPSLLTAIPEVQSILQGGAWTLAAYLATHDAGRGLMGVLTALECFRDMFVVKSVALGTLWVMLQTGPKTLEGAWMALTVSAGVNYALSLALVTKEVRFGAHEKNEKVHEDI